MRIYSIFLILLLGITFGLSGCASSPKYQYLQDDPWYEDVNPMNPQSDWQALDITPETLVESETTYRDVEQDMMDIIDFY